MHQYRGGWRVALWRGEKSSAILRAKVDALLAAIDVLSLETKADQHYGEIRNALEKFGTPIGANDLLIATHALALGLVLVTANTGEFSRVPCLSVEN
ncbi:MAG: PIN domain-containing protein [Methylophilaceae bacterium]